MKFNWKKTSVAVAAGVALMVGASGVAGADGAAGVSGTGFDGVNDVLIGQGSDTTYTVISDLADLYNRAPGCETDNASGSATLGQCKTAAQGQSKTDVNGDWDHDVATNLYPTGSGAGIKALQLNQVDFARSSRAPKTSGESDLNFWAFAKDGIAMVTMAGRPAGNLTKAQIQGIYNCTITDWSSIPGQAAGTIYPYGMNTSSGTYATFQSYLGFDPNAGSCVQKLHNGAGGAPADLPFENDLKQLTGSTATATEQAQASNAIWWGSFAELKTYAFKRQTGEFWSVDGVAIGNGTIANNSYGIKRFIYHVTKKVDATPASAGSDDLVGTASGKGGGVREFTEWLCKASARHTTSLYTGNSLFADATSAISRNGFQRVPTAERTNGACELEPGA